MGITVYPSEKVEQASTGIGLNVPAPDPASLQDEAQRLFDEAAAGIKKDFPNIKFGHARRAGESAVEPALKPTEAVKAGKPFRIGGSDYVPTPPPAQPERGYWDRYGEAFVAQGEKTAYVDPALMYNRVVKRGAERDDFLLQNADRLVAESKQANINILEHPDVKAQAEKWGMRPDHVIRDINKFVGLDSDTKTAQTENLKRELKDRAERVTTLSQRHEALMRTIEQNRPKTTNASRFVSPSGIFYDVSMSALPLAGAIAAGTVAGPGAGLGVMGTMVFPSFYNDGINAGLTEEQASGYATLMTAAETIPETLAIGKLLPNGVARTLEKGFLKTFGGKVAAGAAAEAPSEMITEALQIGVDSGYLNKDTPFKQALSDIAYAGLVGAAMGGGLAVPGATVDAISGTAPEAPPPGPANPRTPPAATPPPRGAGTPPPAGGTPPPATAATPPPAAAAGPPAAAATALPKPGDALMFSPSPNVPGTPVQVVKAGPNELTVARVDEEGEPVTDADGEPIVFVAPYDQFGLTPPAQAPAAAASARPAAPAAAAPAAPSQVPPAATSAEPTSDIAGQVKDMYRPNTGRRGVYVSPDTVAKMKQEGSYDALLKTGVVAENFDGQGGTLIVKSKKDMQEAVAARDGGQTDMQAIVGALTGAGVAKPDVPKPAVVQRKDEKGAVVQQTAVAPEQAAATAAAIGTQPGTVEVTTPEAALAERDAKVAAEQAAQPTQEPAATPQAEAKPKARGALAQLDEALTFAMRAVSETKGPRSVKMDVRRAAHAVGTLAQAMRVAIAEAQARGASNEDVKAAADAAKAAERLTEKDEGDFEKSLGVSEKIVLARLAALSDAVDSLRQWVDKPLTKAATEVDKPAKKPKAEAAKKKGAERRTAEGAALRARIDAMTPEERERAIMRHDLTGLPNRRAMEGAEAPAWAEVDADSLKWVNDNMGEEAGNEMLKAVATALDNADGVTAYHVSGDEFYVSGESQAQIEAALKAVAKTLAGQTIEGQGRTMTPAITWGTGETRKAASAKMKSQKAAREQAGKRAKRGEAPPTARTTAVAPEIPAEQLSRIPAAYREPGKYLFHLVRNVADVAGIVKDGLRKGSNVSMLGGQATEMFAEGETMLVFENPGTSQEKGYQADLLTTEVLKPVAIVVDTTLAEKGEGGEAVYDQLTKDYEQLEADKAAFAKKHKLDGNQLLRIIVSFPKGTTYQEFKAGLNEADLKTLRDLITREERMEKGLEGAEKAAGPAVSTMDVLQGFGQYALPVFSASGRSYVPAGAVAPTATKAAPKRGKKKYVPPKKETDAQAAEALVEKTAPPVRETIDIVAQNVEGQEAQLVTELLGATPQELAMEANLDKSGRLMNVLQAIMVAMKNRGNWTGWFAAVTRGGVLTREQRNGLYSRIRAYAAAARQDLPAAREDLLGFMVDLDGKTLPPQAITGVMEAADAARAYVTVQENLAMLEGEAVEDAAEILADTSQSQMDERDLRGRKIDTGSGEVRQDPTLSVAGREAVSKGKGDSYASRGFKDRQGFRRIGLHNTMKRLTDALNANRWINGVLAKALANQYADKMPISSHSLMDGLIYRLSQIEANTTGAMAKDAAALKRMVTAIRASMPDTPVEILERDKPAPGLWGEKLQAAGGRYFQEGLLQVQLDFDANGLPVWDTQATVIFIHEAAHAASVYELTREGPLRTRAIQLLTQLRFKAREKLGDDIVDEVLDYFGQDTLPAERPESVRKYGRYLYGLTDVFEMVAEGMSNPTFYTFLNSLDQTPTKPWYRQVTSNFFDLIRRLLGLKNPGDGQLVREVVNISMRTMAAQRARQNRRDAYARKTTSDLVNFLKLTPEEAAGIVDLAMNTTETGQWIIRGKKVGDKSKRVTIPDPPRGDRVKDRGMGDPDFMAAQAYTRSADSAWQDIASRRAFQQKTAGTTPAPSRAMRHEEEIGRITTPRLAQAVAAVTRLMRSRFADGLKDTVLGTPTLDFLVRRWSHLFGSETDSTNPLNQLKVIRDTRRSFANQMMELAERTVNSKWMKLSMTESEQVGDVLQETTLWQIDPEAGPNQSRILRNVSKKRWMEKYKEIEAKWNALSPEQQDIYRSVQKYFKTEYSKLRRASMDLAMDLYGVGLTPQQKSLLYALRNPEGADNIIGTGKPIDLADQNERFLKVVKDLIKVSAIKGPYFPLMRKGKYVVEADDQGILNDENGNPREFSNKEDALEEANHIRSLAPRNTAVVRASGDKFIVEYKMRHVSFHNSQNEAAEAIVQLKQNGFAVKGDTYTRKLESVESASMSGALTELVSKAESLAGTGTNEEREAVLKTIRTAFTEILAERAASASSQLKRQGVGGFKGKEAHEVFTRRVRASSWHYANLKTSVPLQRALTKLRQFSTDPEQGHIPPGHTRQSVVVARGRLLSELVNRMRIEVGELENLDKSNVDHWMGQAGFATFLATPSYAMVNSMQNFNVALPVVMGKYGMKGMRAMMRGMRVVAGPSFGRAMRGLVSKPGEVTTYDVYTAIADAVREDPRYAKFVESPDGGKTPSALQQLVDRNVINATYVQELTSVANDQNLLVSKGMDYLRLLPQAAELWNRVSTALAVLDVTNGNVDAAADMVDQVHFQYALENRPRYFRRIGNVRLPQAVTMFKMYGVGMLQLGASLMVDAIGRNKTPQARRQAALSLAGIIASHTLSAGIIGGVMLEPLRALMAVWQMFYGDDDEFNDLDTAIQLWAAEVTGSEVGGQILSRGLWNALGFDLSGRMGLDRILMYNPPDVSREEKFWQSMGSTLVGPLVAENVKRGFRAWELANVDGKPFEAIMTMVPLKAFQDAKRAWEIMSKGVTTRAGEEIVSPETFGVVDAAGRLAGFRTSEESKASAYAATEFKYKNWKTARMRELTRQYWQARDSGDEREIARATAAITRFREKNPGIRFTGQNLLQSKRMAREAARSRVGEGRDPALRELLDY